MTNPFDRFDEPTANTFDRFDAPASPSTVGKALDWADRNVATPVNDTVNWLGTQFTKGGNFILGGATAAGRLNQQIAEWGGEKVGLPEAGKVVGKVLRHAVPGFGLTPSPEELNSIVFNTLEVPEVNAGDNPALTLTNPFGLDAKINFGKMLDAGAQAIPAAAAGPGGVLSRSVPNFLAGVTSEAAGQATAGTPYEIPARVLGGIPGYYAGAKLATPLTATLMPQQQRAVDLAKQAGVPLSVSQETGRGRGVERFLSRMPGGQGVSDKFAARQGAVTDEMALAQAGFKGNETGQETLRALANQAGAEFEAAKKMPGLVDLTPTFPKVRQAVAEYEGVMDPAKRSPVVATEANRFLSKEAATPAYPPLTASAVERPTTMDSLTTAVRNASKPVDEAFDALPSLKSWFDKGPMAPMPKELPELSNQQYQTLRKGLTDSLNTIYKGGIGKDTNAAEALKSMRNALDDAAEASLGPDKLAAWQQARRHYAAFKTIEKAMNSSTTAARSEGTIGANALTGALKRAQGDKFYQTTGGLNDVATIKDYLRDTFPNSGTPTILAGAANVAGMGLPGVAAHLGQRAMTGGFGLGWLRNYLANQSIPNQGMGLLPQSAAPGMLLSSQPGMRLLEDRR